MYLSPGDGQSHPRQYPRCKYSLWKDGAFESDVKTQPSFRSFLLTSLVSASLSPTLNPTHAQTTHTHTHTIILSLGFRGDSSIYLMESVGQASTASICFDEQDEAMCLHGNLLRNKNYSKGFLIE